MLTTENLKTRDRFPSSLSTWIWQGHQIQYSVTGLGTPLVLIHGFGASIGHWKKNIPAWAEAGYQVFALDLLGFGASVKPALDYSLELWEELLRDFHQEFVQRPAIFIGNSIGALLALMLTANSPKIAIGAGKLMGQGWLKVIKKKKKKITLFIGTTFRCCLPILVDPDQDAASHACRVGNPGEVKYPLRSPGSTVG